MHEMALKRKRRIASIFTRKGCPWDEWTCSFCCLGHLECLKYARENGCPWDEMTCAFNAALKYNALMLPKMVTSSV